MSKKCLEERGQLSMQQERDQQVPVCNNMNRYQTSLQDTNIRFRPTTTSANSTTRSDLNGGFINSSNVPSEPSNSASRGAVGSDFEAGTGHSNLHSQFTGGQHANGSGANSSALLHHAADSSTSNYMSLYLRLVYWKQEFSYVHLKVCSSCFLIALIWSVKRLL